jgi:hypothetical protein
MGNGKKFYDGFLFPIEQSKRKAPQHEFPGGVLATGPTVGRLDDQFQCSIHFSHKF